MIKKIAIVMVLISMLISCDMFQEGYGEAISGSLNLSIGDGTSRTLLPTVSMDLVTYDISGLKDSGKTFSESFAVTDSLSILDLTPGDWVITVEGKNGNGDIIGSGSSPVSILSGSSNSATITVKPIVGDGTLDLDLSWSTNGYTFDEVGVLSEIKTAGDVSTEIIFDVDEVNETATSTSLVSTGYYILITKIVNKVSLDGIVINETKAGDADVVRIVNGFTTSGSFAFDNIADTSIGDITITIDEDMGIPLDIEVTSTDADSLIDYRDAFTLEASTTNADGEDIFYEWYLDGTAIDIGSTLTVNKNVYPRIKRGDSYTGKITAIGYTITGDRMGSAKYTFTVAR